MKGATAEPEVKITRLPSRTRQMIMGKSQNFFRSFMKDQSSNKNAPINTSFISEQLAVSSKLIHTIETQSSHGSTVREASRQASSMAFSSEPVEESPRAEFFIAAHPELSRRTCSPRLPCLTAHCLLLTAYSLILLRQMRRRPGLAG